MALFAAGAFSGLGFYTFFPARVTIIVIAFFVLMMGVRWWRPAFVGPLAIGFALVVLPIFAVDKMEVITATLNQSATEAADPLGKQLLENLPRSLFAFNYSPDEGHYVAGALMDNVSAVLAVLGLSYAVSRVRNRPYRFLLIWYVVALTATGLFSVHAQVSFSRMHIVLPAMAAFAGIAVHRILLVLEGMAPADRLKPVAAGLALVVLVPLVFAINVQRFWVDSARASPTHVLTVGVRAVTEGPCAGNGSGNAIVSEGFTPALDYIFGFYGFTDTRPTLLSYEATSPEMLASFRCVVLFDVDSPPAQSLLEELLQDDPSRSVEELQDLSQRNRVFVVRSLD